MPSPLSPFGRLVVKHLKEQGLTRQKLAKVAGITDSAAMTRCLRAKDGTDPKAYAPAPGHLVPWANLLGLVGKERRTFIALGLLDRCSEDVAKALWSELGLEGDWQG